MEKIALGLGLSIALGFTLSYISPLSVHPHTIFKPGASQSQHVPGLKTNRLAAAFAWFFEITFMQICMYVYVCAHLRGHK